MSDKTKLFHAGTIRCDQVDAAVNGALVNLNLKDIPYTVVGNRRIDELNDIDVALDIRDIVKYISLSTDNRLLTNAYTGVPILTDAFWKALEYRVNDSYNVTCIINKGLSQFSFLHPMYNVQIDFMVGDVSFMQDALMGAEFSEYKAAHRNLLLAAFCSVYRWTVYTPSQQEVYMLDGSTYEDKRTFRYKINWRLGVKHTECENNDGYAVLDDDTHTHYMSILRFMQVLSPRLNLKSIYHFDNFEKLYAVMTHSKFMDNDLWYNIEQRNTLLAKVFNEYIVTLERAKLPVPYQIVHYLANLTEQK